MTANELRSLSALLSTLETAETKAELFLLGEAQIWDGESNHVATIELNGSSEHTITKMS